jgi:hypothetical protein
VVRLAVTAGAPAHVGLVQDEQRGAELRDRIAAVDPADRKGAVSLPLAAPWPDGGGKEAQVID